MDKSFNDQELSDIMKEIEALEEEFTAEASQKSEPELETGPESETGPVDVLQELVDLDEEKVVQKTNLEEKVLNFQPQSSALEAVPKASTAPASMTFKVQGHMELELQFEIGGKTVALAVTETGLTIELENGATFSIPVSDAHSLKKAV